MPKRMGTTDLKEDGSHPQGGTMLTQGDSRFIPPFAQVPRHTELTEGLSGTPSLNGPLSGRMCMLTSNK